MKIFQEYVGINQTKIIEDASSKELSDGCGYYIIDKYFEEKSIEKIIKDLINIEKEQVILHSLDKENSEYGQIRSPFLYSKFIRNILCSEFILKLVKKHLVGNGICHLINGQIIRKTINHNQSLWHRDFNKSHISNPIMAFNILCFLGEYDNFYKFSTLKKSHQFSLIPGSQKSHGYPNIKIEKTISLNPGSLLVFNSQLWHKVLVTGNDQLFLNLMFTEPFIKQQINLLGASKDWIDKNINKESELARIIGWWSRPPSDINEFRNPPNNLRTYRSEQG